MNLQKLIRLKWIKGTRDKLNLLPAIMERLASLQDVPHRLERVEQALGRIEGRQLQLQNTFDLNANEFQVFSQWGEDGILQFLLRHIKIDKQVFVEFGVEDYSEANTRFLLKNNNWAGLIMDGSHENIARIKRDAAYWFYNLKTVEAFVTRDNINQLMEDNGIHGEIGLLSIDIDGNDYWVWEAITVIEPIIVVIEYNHRFGSEVAVVVPYDADFDRARAHHSMIYYGASVKALCLLAERKGYAFIGCNSNGVNAFFVRKDHKPESLRELSAQQGYMTGQFADARDSSGRLMKMELKEEQALLWTLPLVDLLPIGASEVGQEKHEQESPTPSVSEPQ